MKVMKMIRSAGVLTLALALAACGAKQNAAPDNRTASSGATESNAAIQIYSGTGTVKSVAGDQVTIAHGPIPAVGWPAMTMAYTAPANVAAGVKAGDKIEFAFKKDGSAYVLTSVKPR